MIEGEYLNPWIADMGEDALRQAVQVFESDTSPLITQMRDAARGESYFGLWLMQADASLRAGTGLSILDLDGSWPWRRAYLDDRHPGASALRAMADHPRWGLMLMKEPEEIQDPPRPTQ